jgi:hypothetical protein
LGLRDQGGRIRGPCDPVGLDQDLNGLPTNAVDSYKMSIQKNKAGPMPCF